MAITKNKLKAIVGTLREKHFDQDILTSLLSSST